MTIQRVASKWEKTRIIKQKELLTHYIPETRKYSLDHLKNMLLTHEIVYLKPDRGTYGIGVMSVENWKDELSSDSPQQFKFRHGIQSQVYPTIEELHAVLVDKIGKREYLIQKGITMLTYRRRKFDIRALVQKTPQGNWETTGFIARVAAPNKIITNHHGGGTIQPIEDMLGFYLAPKEFADLYKEMKLVGVQVAAQLNRKLPNLKEIGLDIAIDEQFHIWILEVNTLPALYPFKILRDKTIYKKIRRYAIAYGRLKATSNQ
ncbi:YheC/YheD family protein [Paenibacillus segetis]|uniref:YheC/D like ATP-grasp n=1 Tax=Paenibacillus segetis TaxID=1325360 RepID=A0ABQ1YM11_9BACL|nr:YheC/YheD family protein [Paenibacillus segetis]GGH29782.1 hypothetical protein GCM10008013_32480 [Paenibacillus segetis]